MRALTGMVLAALTASAASAQLRYWVSVQVDDGPNELRLYRGGQLQLTMEQFGGAADDPVGFRDGTSDEEHIYFGWSGGIVQYNRDGTEPTVIIDGPPPSFGSWRTLAVFPPGDSWRGTFFAADGDSEVIEVDRNGQVLRTFPNPGHTIVGMAIENHQYLWTLDDEGLRRIIDLETWTLSSTKPAILQNVGHWSGLDEVPVSWPARAAIGDNTLACDSGIPRIGPWPLSGDGQMLGVAVVREECAGYVCGDANCDGVFDGGDIDDFFLFLGDPTWHMCGQQPCPCLRDCVAEVNGDGEVNGVDIDAFFDALMLGRCP